MTDWTIEAELLRAADTASLDEACHRLRLVDADDSLSSLIELEPWVRGGAETYIFKFEVRGKSGRRSRVALKAMVAATPGIPPVDQLKRRLHRRDALASAGCPVPELYGVGEGVYFEALLERDLVSVVKAGPPDDVLQSDLAAILGALSQCGFDPLSIMPNIMEAGSRLFWIDFGTDLGEVRKASATALLAERALSEYVKFAGRPSVELSRIAVLARAHYASSTVQ